MHFWLDIGKVFPQKVENRNKSVLIFSDGPKAKKVQEQRNDCGTRDED